nr:MobF family relaxase [Fimbriiglobus ruber]
MLRFHPVANATAAIAYFSKSDGYYAAGDLRQEWLGHGAELLGLSGTPNFDHFKRLIHGHDPHTGDQLTAKLVENRIPAWDVTASIPKGVTVALENGDSRIQDALWEAARETLADLEQYSTTRVRKGGALDDRLTGNLVAFAVEHPETRPAKQDNMPDPDRHIHIVVMNVTHDPIEDEWKAVKFRPIMDLRKFFDRSFDLRLASKLTDLGYGIETSLKADARGTKRYYSWDIKGMPDSVVKKFSRRTGEVEKLAAELGVGSATGKDKLGATSRQFKRTDMTLEDYRKYWQGRITPAEGQAISSLITAANLGLNPEPTNTADKGVRFAIDHHFERRSVMDWHDLAVTSMERCMGGALPEEIEPEAKRQGALMKDGQVTTKAVLAEERRIIDFAREGKGTMRPLAIEGQPVRESAQGKPHAEGAGRVISELAMLLGLGQQKGANALNDVGSEPMGSELRVRDGQSPAPRSDPMQAIHAAATLPDPAILSHEQQLVSSARSEPQNSSLIDPKQGKLRAPDAHGAAPGQNWLSPSLSNEKPANIAPAPPLSPKQQATSSDHIPDARKMVGLSNEQQAMVSHVLTSTDQMVLVIGDAGTGKTHAIKSAFAQIDRPVEMLAASAEASRGVLRSPQGGGFRKADTVASFLMSPDRQAGVKNGVIWVDEAGLLAIKDLSRIVDIANEQHARIVLQGDPKQHRSVVRHGNMMNVLQEYAGLSVGRLTEVWRQKHKGYKAIVAGIAEGKQDKAFDQLAGLGWVQKVEDNKPLVDDYIQGINSGKEILVVAPTHAEADEVTAAIRSRLQDEGKLSHDEHKVQQLIPLNWTEAERGDLERYDGSETLVFHRNSGTFKAGQVVSVTDFKDGDRWKSPEHFSVYHKGEVGIATGDLVRFTSNGKSLDGHKLNNGSVYRIKGFDKHENPILDNGWTVKKEYGHLTHGYVSTSHASQGKTVDRVLIAMGSESKGAINAEQFYVSVSRGRESAKVYSDMAQDELKQAIQRTDARRSATELMQPKKKPRRRAYEGLRKFLAKARDRFKVLQAGLAGDTREQKRQKEYEYGR